jgi:hypothetical protein
MALENPAARQKVKVFSKSAALTAEESPLIGSGDQDSDGSHVTLNLDVAMRLDGQKGFNWADKITIQLTSLELPEFCALLMGYIDQMKAQRNDKGIELERQNNAIYLKATKRGGGMYTLPITTAAIFKLNVLTLELLKKQNKTHDVNVIIASLRMFAKR